MRRMEGDAAEAGEPRPDWTPEEHAGLEERFKQVAYGGWVLPLGGAASVILFSQRDWVGNAPALLLGQLLALLWLGQLRRQPIWYGTYTPTLLTPREAAQFRWVMRRVSLRPALLAYTPLLLLVGTLALLWLWQGPRPPAEAGVVGVVALLSFCSSWTLLACVLYLQGLGILRRHGPSGGA